MPAFIDLVGQRFARLTVLERTSSRAGKVTWRCRCDCGSETSVIAGNLRTGVTKSCGCWHREQTAKANTRHGKAGTVTYGIWKGMVRRCTAPAAQHFEDYGGRGIKVCRRWEKFENFLADMGERPPGLTLERRNNNGDYKPSNCMWASRIKQARNRRSSHLITYQGRTQTLQAWADEVGLQTSTLRHRLKKVSLRNALFAPLRNFKANQ